MLLYSTEHSHSTFLTIYSELDVKMSSVLPTADYYLIISESTWLWLVRLASPVFTGVRRGDKMGICHRLEFGTKNQKFLENLKSAG